MKEDKMKNMGGKMKASKGGGFGKKSSGGLGSKMGHKKIAMGKHAEGPVKAY